MLDIAQWEKYVNINVDNKKSGLCEMTVCHLIGMRARLEDFFSAWGCCETSKVTAVTSEVDGRVVERSMCCCNSINFLLKICRTGL